MHTTSLLKVGGSVMLAVPPPLLHSLELRAGTPVNVGIMDGRLVVEPRTRPAYTLEELLAQCDEADPDDAEDCARPDGRPRAAGSGRDRLPRAVRRADRDAGGAARHHRRELRPPARSLDDAGSRTRGVIRCDRPRVLVPAARNGKGLEAVPEAVMDEVLARLAAILT